jgi:hypothetical protein
MKTFKMPQIEINHVVKIIIVVVGASGNRVKANDVWVPEISRNIEAWSSL